MTGPGAAASRRRWCSTTPRAAARSTPRRCWLATPACCSATATRSTRAWPRRDGGEGATLVYCWSHVRREFYDLAKKKTAPIAAEALRRIAALYQPVEKVVGQPEGSGAMLKATAAV